MQLMEEQKALYKKYGTTKPDEEFRTIYIRGVPTKKSIREIVEFKERLKEMEAQREECRRYNLKRKAEKEQQIAETRKYNLEIKAKKDLIKAINMRSTIR